jgi:hypothetical protein
VNGKRRLQHGDPHVSEGDGSGSDQDVRIGDQLLRLKINCPMLQKVEKSSPVFLGMVIRDSVMRRLVGRGGLVWVGGDLWFKIFKIPHR